MARLTVTVDDEVLERARVRALEHGTSVNALVRDYLAEEHGWTRRGFGKAAEKETTLAAVLERMLTAQDVWTAFAERYLGALDAAAEENDRPQPSWDPETWRRRRRTRALAQWHGMLLDRLVDSEAEELLDRLVDHPALEGPELTFLQARLAHRRGDSDRARDLVHDCLEDLPGHRGFLAFAQKIDAPLPARAQEGVRRRAR